MQDKFIPMKWFNEVFTELINNDIIARPSKRWTLHPFFFFRKRPWLTTKKAQGWLYDWQLDWQITWWHYYNNIVYPYSDQGSLYSFDGDELTSVKTNLDYNSSFSSDTLQTSYLWWGRYPDNYTVYTVKSYDAVAGKIELNETLSSSAQADIVWKYVYMKTWPSQWWERNITVADATHLTLLSGFSIPPVAGNVIWIYKKMISQMRYPQLREWDETTYFFHINSTISTTPSVGATYTNNGTTFTYVSGDLVSGKWYLRFTASTWEPSLTGTLTRTAGTGDATITFYDSDKWSERFYSRDTEWNEMYRYFPNDKKVIGWDNRIIGMHKNWQTILPRDSQDYEQIMSTKMVTLWSAVALNIDVYSWYLLVFYGDRVWLLRKTITDTATQSFIYTYQDILTVWLYSEKSYIVRGGNLYIFANDNRLYSVSLTSNASSEVIAILKDQWQTMIEYFKNITWGRVEFKYGRWILRMIHTKDDNSVDVFKYFEWYEWWMVDKYDGSWNLFNIMYNIGNIEYISKWDKIYSISGIKDWEDNIDQYIRMEWPLQEYLDIFTLQKVKWRLWFDGENKMWCDIKITIWGSKKTIIEKNITQLKTIDDINQYIIWGWTIGWWIVGDYVIWWEAWVWDIIKYYSDYIDIATNVGKKWSYVQFEFRNNTDSQMIFGGMKLVYNLYNPNVAYNKLVI